MKSLKHENIVAIEFLFNEHKQKKRADDTIEYESTVYVIVKRYHDTFMKYLIMQNDNQVCAHVL